MANSVAAPITGTVDTKVSAGASVTEGQVLAVQISTKTEYQIVAPASGRVTKIVDKGASVKEGEIIAEIKA